MTYMFGSNSDDFSIALNINLKNFFSTYPRMCFGFTQYSSRYKSRSRKLNFNAHFRTRPAAYDMNVFTLTAAEEKKVIEMIFLKVAKNKANENYFLKHRPQ